MNTAKRQVVISGGGPSGLAAALLFADLGWDDIVVVERRNSPRDFETNKAFNYQIDPRGQRLLKRLGINYKLKDYGVANRDFTLTTIKTNGDAIVSNPPVIDPDRATSYWTTRRNLLTMLFREIEKRDDQRIRLMYSHSFKSIETDANGNPQVVIEDIDQAQVQLFSPELLLACDGLTSRVRRSLQSSPSGASGQFDMIQYPSPSAGLTYKVLNLPACFPVRGAQGEAGDHRMTYSIVSRHKDRSLAMALFAFPVTDPNQPRSVNIIREADHTLWTIKDPEHLIRYLQDAFPQLNIAEIVTQEEAQNFVSIAPGQFPVPQYANGIHCRLDSGTNAMDCLLIGDAAHAFPPDLGLGVNSAFEDLHVLDRVFANNDGDIAASCREFEQVRLPNNAALVRLVQTVAPYQYNQIPWRLKKWVAGFVLQLGLYKLMPSLIDKPTFRLTQDPNLDFVEIERRQKRSERILQGLGLLLAFIAMVGMAAIILR